LGGGFFGAVFFGAAFLGAAFLGAGVLVGADVFLGVNFFGIFS
jgi:hypothetical protein